MRNTQFLRGKPRAQPRKKKPRPTTCRIFTQSTKRAKTLRSKSHCYKVTHVQLHLDTRTLSSQDKLLNTKGEQTGYPIHFCRNQSRSRWVQTFWNRSQNRLDRFQNFWNWSRNRPGPVLERGIRFHCNMHLFKNLK